ncbi:FUN14 domain-containing protein 1 [Podila humilis]|nr:FUN14 domain-containing protein 1 [Podila humilis]
MLPTLLAMRPTAVSILTQSIRTINHSNPLVSSTLGLASSNTGRVMAMAHVPRRFASSAVAFPSKVAAKPSLLKTVAASSAFSSNTLIGAGAATTCVFGPLFWGRTFGSSRSVIHCAPAATYTPRSGNIYAELAPDREPLINSKELTFGAAMGLCSGYLFKKLGKMMMLVVGLGFVWLQLLSSSGYIQVNWVKVEHKFKQQFDLDNDGKVTLNDAKHGFRGLIELLTRNFQFKSTFAGGFFLGFKYG